MESKCRYCHHVFLFLIPDSYSISKILQCRWNLDLLVRKKRSDGARAYRYLYFFAISLLVPLPEAFRFQLLYVLHILPSQLDYLFVRVVHYFDIDIKDAKLFGNLRIRQRKHSVPVLSSEYSE